MKKFWAKSIFLLVFFIFYRLNATVGWENPINISPVRAGLYCHNGVIAGSEDLLAIVWEEKEKRNGITRLKIAFGPSETAFQEKTLATFQAIYYLQPDIMLVEDTVLITYSAPDGEIYVLCGKERGKFWYLPNRISFTPAISLQPKFYFDKEQNKLYLFYIEEEGGHYFLRYTYSLNKGATWQTPATILNSQKTGIAIFFPSIFMSEGKFYIVYQGRPSFKQDVKGKDTIFIAIVNEKNGDVKRNEELVNPKKEIQYTPIVNKARKNIIWQESEDNIWNIYTGLLEDDKDVVPVRINTERKNCYGHTALVSSENDHVKIFWSMTGDVYSQIYSRKYYFKNNQLGNQELVVQASHNCYSPAAVLFHGVEYVLWQEEYSDTQSAVVLKKQDTSAFPPMIVKPDKDIWYSTTDINVVWRTPPDPSGNGGSGFLVSTRPQPDKVLQNLPSEVNSLNLQDLLVEGTNYFQLRFFDGAGNGSEVVTKIIKVDQTGPFIEQITSPTHPLEQFVTNRTAVVEIKARDNYQTVKGFAYQVDYGKEKAVKEKRIMARNNVIVLKLKKGISYLKVSAIDPSGNWGSVAMYPFYVSRREAELVAMSTAGNTGSTKIIKKVVEHKVQTNEIKKIEVKKITTNLVALVHETKTNKKIQTNLMKTKIEKRPATNLIVKVEKKAAKVETNLKNQPEISVEESEKARIIRNYLDKYHTVLSRRIYNGNTEDIIGGPFNLSMEEKIVDGLKLKKVKFTIYTASALEDPLLPPPDEVFIWSPILNYSGKKSEIPWVPVFVINDGKIYEGKNKKFKYFTFEIPVLPDQDFIIIFTLRGRQMKSSIVTIKRHININLVPNSLKWLIYDKL